MNIENMIRDAFNLMPEDIQSFSWNKEDNTYYIHITLTDWKPACPYCGGNAVVKEYRTRTYHHLPLFGHPTDIIWRRRRYVCKDDGRSFSESNPFGPENFHQTYAVLNKIAIALASPHKTFKDIANEYNVSSQIVSLYADSFLHAPRVPLPENLGIDEIYSHMSKYGGSYLCVLVDNNTRQLVDILPNRSKRTLSDYFERIPKAERDRVKYVTMDLWEPYKEVAQKYLKNSCCCGDPFHVIQHLTQAFTGFRVSLMNQCIKGSSEYYMLKHWHDLFLVLDEKKLNNTPKYNSFFRTKMNYQDLFDVLLSVSTDLTQAYYLMRDYRNFNLTATEIDCEEKLDKLIDAFQSIDLPCYKKFIELLIAWRPEIINSFKKPDGIHRESNALTENTNQRIRELLYVSNGYSNFERFRARVLYCYNKSTFYALTQTLDSRKHKGVKRGHYRKKTEVEKMTQPALTS